MGFLAALVLGAATGLIGGGAAAQDQAPERALEAPVRQDTLAPFLEGVVLSHMREHGVPGVTLSVVRDGEILFAKGYGVADSEGRPVVGDRTFFRIGSVSKTFHWTALMVLVEEGRIDLDADVNDYLDDVEVPEAFGEPITVRDLMAHRTGFEDTLSLFTHSDEEAVLDAALLQQDMPKRAYPPGGAASYSNYGAALGAKIVEDVSGQPYAAFIEERFLRPLGMASTTLQPPGAMDPALRERLSTAFAVRAGEGREVSYMQGGPYAPVGFMSSTASDMARWMGVHLGEGEWNGVRVLSPATHARLRSRAYDDWAAAPDMAHGFATEDYRGVQIYGHGGSIDGFLSGMHLIPELGIGIFVSQNANGNRGLVEEIGRLVVDHELGPVPTPGQFETPDPEADLSSYAGKYLSNRRSWTRFEKSVAIGSPAAVTAQEGTLIVALGGEARTYRRVRGSEDVFEARDGTRLRFERDGDGRVARIAGEYGQSFERVGAADSGTLLEAALGLSAFFALTTFLGAWRRQGRTVRQDPAGRALGVGALVVAGVVVATFAALGFGIVQLAGLEGARMLDWPIPAVQAVRAMFTLWVVLSVPVIGGVIVAWTRSGWSVWRKLHLTFFVAAFAFAAVEAVRWNLAFAPFS